MTAPADRASPSPARLQSALLEYFEAPGKYQLSLRQPTLLFASIREILQLAAGRSAGVAQPENKTVMEAAAFFIRAALLYPGATHYAVMGLPTRAEPVELKERYRLLMRLIHPDFAVAHSQTWPGDAAVRVNRAYEVLSSPVLRADYDEQLAAAGSQRTAAAPKTNVHAPAAKEPEETASWRFNRAAVWILAGCGILLVVASLIPWQDADQLIQKSEAPAPGAEEDTPAPPTAKAQVVAATNVPAEAPPPLVLAAQGPPPPPAPAPLPAPVQPPPPAPAPAAARAAPPMPAPAPAPAPARAPAPAAMHAPAAAPAPVAARAVTVAPAAARAPAPHAEPPVQLRASPNVPTPGPQLAAPQRPVAAPVVVAAESPRLAPATQLSAPEPARPAERRVEASVAAPPPAAVAAVREEPARPVQAAAAPSRPEHVPGPTGTEPSLTDAQPLLTQLLQSMEGGSGEHILRLLENDARRSPSALALSRQYEQLVGRARPVHLSHVEFRSEAREGILFVTGRVRLHAGNPTIGAVGEPMSLRAEFVSRGGRVLLTGLSSGAPD